MSRVFLSKMYCVPGRLVGCEWVAGEWGAINLGGCLARLLRASNATLRSQPLCCRQRCWQGFWLKDFRLTKIIQRVIEYFSPASPHINIL